MHALDWVSGVASQLAEQFTLARLAYSALACIVIAILAKSVMATWQTGSITLGDFEYYADGARKPEFGQQIRGETFEFYNLIVRLIQQEAERFKMEGERRDQKDESDTAGRLPVIQNEQVVELGSKSNELQQLEITVEGVNVKNLVTALGRVITPSPRELTASIFSSNNSRRVFVTAPTSAGKEQARPVPALVAGGIENDTNTAFRIACYMIWSQWKEGTSDFGVKFGEFCRVARLLYIRSTLDSLPPYEFDKQKYKDDVDFLKDTYKAAALASPEYRLIYSSLSGLQRYVGDEKINLTPASSATIDSLVDIIGLYALEARRFRSPGDGIDWLKGLPPDASDRKIVNAQYFQHRLMDDCPPPPSGASKRGIPDAVRSQFQNVVRIIYERKGAPVVTSGIILSDETAVTVFPRRGPAAEIPAEMEIQLISCGKIFETHRVEKVSRIAEDSPFVRLTVPGLKATLPLPSITDASLDDPDRNRELYVVGYLRRTSGLYFGPRERVPDGIDNNDRRVSRAEQLPSWSSVGDDDDLGRFDLNVPYGPGMIGSPVFAPDGRLLGLLDIGEFLNRGQLVLAVGIPAKTLAPDLKATH
ncbi:serine protease [Bradyrhizobium ontarionense]|uniref:Serine protease n=1 Tax=Bradyrhizobium ontarionense TaxID=2898149 RepID=A0ABY3RMY9_9BRAD|nr:serine protease [Bradyrhizobium sp. A19]UFZ08073.1 serine protease [Bradyrhizobium sp. A19]